jgi:hypothetical protein
MKRQKKAREKKRKKKSGFLTSFIIVLLLVCQASANFAWIDDVVVIPSQPLDIDVITLDISGSASSGGSHIVSSLFQQEENQLTLDLTIDMGITTEISYWSHSEQIGTLVPGTYSTTVRLFFPYAPPGEELQDTYTVDFTVVPEPATLVLFGLGGLLLRNGENLCGILTVKMV